ncbi:MAG: PAS domain S-box protein [Alphaproteobacteria bacterium]|nr:PAS domain S-box protein [Alphaproteobacteria bacterium]MBU1517094.1 PAS domain S-box protein [Alphaproteobacteria bacterium]MBU2093713.1 PAS domain S-box protein [Alphaproteobacteria bacterium]MBU2153965.1 PAS domain S-box protein [Alphaproteobacteria bacterium]MBU2308687.1 PAS domain S-box protein [Alphaproteobacteria bacterium]
MIDNRETARLRSLLDYGVVDTAPDEAFDRLTQLAAELFDAPIATVSLIDAERQWFKSKIGIDDSETHRDLAFCAHAIALEPDAVMVVEDATRDARFAANPLVTGDPNIRFYAGAVLSTPDGHNLGTLCVIDDKPRAALTEADLRRLRALARIVVDELELGRAKRQAEEKQRLLELAEHMSGVGHWRLHIETGAVTWSDELYRIHGVDRETFDPALDEGLAFFSLEDQARISDSILNTIITGEGYAFEHTMRRRDGALRDVACKAAAERDETGKVIALIGVFQDVTDRRAQERAVAASEARYRLIADNASDLIMQYDLRGRIAYVSPSVVAVTGYAADDLMGRPALDFVNPEDRAEVEIAVAAQFVSHGKTPPRPVAYRGMRKDGREIWLEATPAVAFDPVSGQMCGVTDVIRDVTAREALEQDLRDARAEAEAATTVKSEFLANMSHELRTPLTSIIGFTGLIAAQPELSAVSRGFVDRVADASRALLATVNDVLDFSKLEAGQVTVTPEPTDPARLCRTALDLFTPQAGAKDLALDFACDLPDGLTVQLDPDRVRQVLLNLVGNAVKFSARGGVTLALRHADDRLRIDVRDTGPGMTPEQQARLFQRFSEVDGALTRKAGGTGLGLAICRGLVEAMGGEIGATSEPGRGSCFWFEIPAPAVHETAASGLIAGLGAMPTPGVRVLVVDDHAANRELVRLFLSGVGVEVTEADSAAVAIETAAAWPFDAILMDLNMPRMGGAAACAVIRRGGGPNETTPILAFSAVEGRDADVSALTAAGFDGLVSKPVDPAALIAAVVRATDFSAPLMAETLEPLRHAG